MKELSILLLLVISLAVVGCGPAAQTPSQQAPGDVPAAAPPAAEPTPQNPSTTPPTALDTQMRTDCKQVIDPHVMADAFPNTFDELSQTGDVIAATGNTPDDQGNQNPGANAVKTLTKNDDYYLTFTGIDACGFNPTKLSYHQLVVGTNDYGWVKAETINGYPALLSYNTDADSYTLSVLLKDRLLIQVDGDSKIGEDRVIRAGQTVDLKKIENAMPQ